MGDRKGYPEVRGKVVDYIRHSVDDGTLSVTVAFKDKPQIAPCCVFGIANSQ